MEQCNTCCCPNADGELVKENSASVEANLTDLAEREAERVMN